MKITKKQLKQIIKEEIQKISESDIADIRARMGLDPADPISDEETQAALAGEERPITWDTIDEINRRIDALELKVYKGIDE